MVKATSSLLKCGKSAKKRVARSKKKKPSENNSHASIDDPNTSLVKTGNSEPVEHVTTVSVKKRKRKNATASEVVEGFNVFQTSKQEPVWTDERIDQAEEDQLLKEKKELNRQIERDIRLRKIYEIHVSGNNVPSPLQNFDELSSRYGCEPYLLQNLAELGFTEPTPIQRQAIPLLLSGRECFASAPTGSGKTFAFLCPMLMRLKHASKDGIRGVILCHTQELAAQTTRECEKMAKGNNFCIKLLNKKLVKSADFSQLPCDILISTPLRLKLSIDKKKIDLSRVEYLVLDESHMLFKRGMIKQTDSVVKACSNPSIIRSLFSSTLPDYVEEVALSVMHAAVRVVIGKKNTASESVKQKLVFVGSEEGKLLALRQRFAGSLNPPVLIFVQSKERAEELYEELKFEGIKVDVIHANLAQTQRTNAIDDFRAGKTWVLIATDVVGCGMDFKGVNCVINYDFPDCAATYIHRIGRTGRAGRTGEGITFYTDVDVKYLRNIANAMAASGSDVPSWLMDLPKNKWKDHHPPRKSISTLPKK